MFTHKKLFLTTGLFIAAFLVFALPHSVRAACASVPLKGSYTITSSCAFAASGTTGVFGVDYDSGVAEGSRGSITLDTGVTLTVNANQTIVWSPGESIIIGEGAEISLSASGAKLQKAYIYYEDADSDDYPDLSTATAATSSPGANYKTRTEFATTHSMTYTTDFAYDSDDTDGNVYYGTGCNAYASSGYQLDTYTGTASIASDDLDVDTSGGQVKLDAFTCGISTVDDADSNTYNTVVIANGGYSECWMATNMNVGSMIASPGTMPSNDSAVEKWCNGANGDAHTTSGDCATYGGLYTWAEAMGLSTSCVTATCCSNTDCSSNQGICPTGWHIPTDTEQHALDNAYDSGTCNASRTTWGCDPAGTALKVGGSSGFEGILTGLRFTNGLFSGRGVYTYFWSSSEDSASTAWERNLNTSYSAVHRHANNKAYGFSVRCIKD